MKMSLQGGQSRLGCELDRTLALEFSVRSFSSVAASRTRTPSYARMAKPNITVMKAQSLKEYQSAYEKLPHGNSVIETAASVKNRSDVPTRQPNALTVMSATNNVAHSTAGDFAANPG
jgi:hypothetical protein